MLMAKSGVINKPGNESLKNEWIQMNAERNGMVKGLPSSFDSGFHFEGPSTPTKKGTKN